MCSSSAGERERTVHRLTRREVRLRPIANQPTLPTRSLTERSEQWSDDDGATLLRGDRALPEQRQQASHRQTAQQRQTLATGTAWRQGVGVRALGDVVTGRGDENGGR